MDKQQEAEWWERENRALEEKRRDWVSRQGDLWVRTSVTRPSRRLQGGWVLAEALNVELAEVHDARLGAEMLGSFYAVREPGLVGIRDSRADAMALFRSRILQRALEILRNTDRWDVVEAIESLGECINESESTEKRRVITEEMVTAILQSRSLSPHLTFAQRLVLTPEDGQPLPSADAVLQVARDVVDFMLSAG